MTADLAGFLRRADIVQPDWTLATCRSSDPELFYPGRGEDSREAKRVCSGCPIRQGCFDYAVDAGEHFGVWGGASERERRTLKSARNRQQRQALR